MLFSAMIVLISWLVIIFVIYIIVIYDTVANHSSDLLSWRNSQIQSIDNEQYISNNLI